MICWRQIRASRLKENVTGPELKRLQVDGVTYGIAQHMRTFNSVIYRKDLLQKYGIGIEELSDDIFENEDILKMVCDGENGKIVPYVTDMGVLNRLGFWVIDECELLVYGRNGKFMNAFETEELRNYLSQMKHLWDQNLISTYAQSAGEFFPGFIIAIQIKYMKQYIKCITLVRARKKLIL